MLNDARCFLVTVTLRAPVDGGAACWEAVSVNNIEYLQVCRMCKSWDDDATIGSERQG